MYYYNCKSVINYIPTSKISQYVFLYEGCTYTFKWSYGRNLKTLSQRFLTSFYGTWLSSLWRLLKTNQKQTENVQSLLNTTNPFGKTAVEQFKLHSVIREEQLLENLLMEYV